MSLKRYTIRYTDAHDPACPVFTTTRRAYDAEDAEELFLDSPDDGWKVLSVTPWADPETSCGSKVREAQRRDEERR